MQCRASSDSSAVPELWRPGCALTLPLRPKGHGGCQNRFREPVNGRGMGVSKVTHMPEDAKEALGHGVRAKRSRPRGPLQSASTGSTWRPIANHAPVQRIDCSLPDEARPDLPLCAGRLRTGRVRPIRNGDAADMRFTNSTLTMTRTLSSCHNAPGRRLTAARNGWGPVSIIARGSCWVSRFRRDTCRIDIDARYS